MQEYRLFQLASKIATPLSIGTLALLVLYGVYKAILGLDVFPKLTETAGFLLLNSLVNKLFILALVGLVLGILAHVYAGFLQHKLQVVSPATGNITVQGGDLSEGKRLIYVTENASDTTTAPDHSGLALNFTLTNHHSRPVTIHSIKLQLKDFKPASTSEFQRYLERIPPDRIAASAQIPVHGLHVVISPTEQKIKAQWGWWDDSAGCRGALFGSVGKEGYKKMGELLGSPFGATSHEIISEESELLPPSLRFSLTPGESESFYCQVQGSEEGLYTMKFVVGYHSMGTKEVIESDREYGFGWVDKFRRSLEAARGRQQT